MDKEFEHFVWDEEKEISNFLKHGIAFMEAREVFRDPNRRIIVDKRHSGQEERYFCVGLVNGRLITVRFTYRKEKVRIIGAGIWRMGRKHYHEKKL